MTIPTQTEMFKHVLDFFIDYPGEFSRKVVKDKMAVRLGLTNDEKKMLTSSGVPVYQSRVGWAISHLDTSGLIDRVARGVYRINDAGIAISEQKMTPKNLAKILQGNILKTVVDSAEDDEITESEESPFEELDNAIQKLRDQVGFELLDRILSKDPQFFEQLTVDLIERMGYGKGKTTQYVGDGGIDGIIATDILGFDPIYIQAKRYDINNSVGKPEIQKFAGAMNDITRGVFITTSGFSKGTREWAEICKHGTIKLIDGKELVELMMDYGLGVTVEKTYTTYRLDVDYFEED